MNRIILVLLLAGLHAACKGQQPFRRIDSLLKATYPGDEPGASVAIESQGQVIFLKSYGMASLQAGSRNSPSTQFNIGSLTKQFTAMAILQLAGLHKLSLSDPLIKFFPDFSPHAGNLITIRELLTHTSGIMDHYGYVDTNRVRHATDADVLTAVRKVDSTYFTPGTRFRYSNTAYCLLGMIIEKVSGMSYPDYISTHIFSPLSLREARVLQIGKPIRDRAVGYDTAGSHFRRLDADESIFFSTEADGGIYLSISQYLRWFHALQSGKGLDSASVSQARSAQVTVEGSSRLSYGYGWFVNEQFGEKVVYHTGSNGGFRAIAFSIPSLDYLVVVFSNRTGVDLEKLVEEINKILRVTNKSYIKIDSLESFNISCPIFAPWKEII